MAEAVQVPEKKKQSSLPAILGWGFMAIFSVAFVWLITQQLGENWSKREDEAKKIVREFKPAGADTSLQDLTKLFSLKAKERGAYVGEFSWDAKQKEGPDYEVVLLWKEEGHTRQAMWRVSLKTGEVRPQGSDAIDLPKRALSGGAEG